MVDYLCSCESWVDGGKSLKRNKREIIIFIEKNKHFLIQRIYPLLFFLASISLICFRLQSGWVFVASHGAAAVLLFTH